MDFLKNSATASYSTLLCAFLVGMCVFVLFCAIRHIANYPIVFRQPRLPVGKNTAYCSHGDQSNWIRDPRVKDSWRSKNIKTRINQLINLQVCSPLLSIALDPFAFPQTGNQHDHWFWWGKQLYPIFRIWTAVLISPTSCQYYILHL